MSLRSRKTPIFFYILAFAGGVLLLFGILRIMTASYIDPVGPLSVSQQYERSLTNTDRLKSIEASESQARYSAQNDYTGQKTSGFITALVGGILFIVGILGLLSNLKRQQNHGINYVQGSSVGHQQDASYYRYSAQQQYPVQPVLTGQPQYTNPPNSTDQLPYQAQPRSSDPQQYPGQPQPFNSPNYK